MKKNRKISKNSRQVILIVVLIFLFRIVYVDLYKSLQDNYGQDIYSYTFRFLRDFISLTFSIAMNVVFVIQLNKRFAYGKYPTKRILILLCYLIGFSFIITALVNRGIVFSPDTKLWTGEMLLSYLAVLLVNSITVVVIDLIYYYYKSRKELAAEADKKRKAQYQYQQLKQQLNPHFLFNSLNMLDFLVQNGENQRASDYINKLARVYRYLLSEAENKVVTLKEELDFVHMYIDLLKERFTDGFSVDISISKSELKRKIVPCGLQLLVENATKHNVVDRDSPLEIKIYVEDGFVVVSNNIQPKMMSSVKSTGLGLLNIRKQYMDIANEQIIVSKTATHFVVYLPLI